MGFFTKTREKGLKSVTKQKEKKSTVITTVVKNNNIQEIKKPLTPTQPTFQDNKIDEQNSKRQKSENVSQQSTLSSSSSSSSPWWVGDLSFVVEGKKITSHKVVVSSKSNVLAKMVESNPSGVIEINNFSHYTFSQLIKWIYGGRFEITVQDAENLRACAAEFDVQDLVEACISAKKIDLHFNPVIMASNTTELEQQHHLANDFSVDIPDFNDGIVASSTLLEGNEFDMATNPLDQGMSIWSDDPILYNPEPHEIDAYRLMEIF